jgi:arylsulfatase A-like enzyme
MIRLHYLYLSMKNLSAHRISFLLLCLFVQVKCYAQTETRPNIIFIILDDLNDYTTSLGGHPQALTPNIQRIEDVGTTFTNAHASAPKCAPSRTSFMTGKDPSYTGIYFNMACKPLRDFFTDEDGNEEVFTLPEYFKDYGGYYTYGINKSLHCFDTYFDFDSATVNPCDKDLSWSKYSLFNNGEDSVIFHFGTENSDGIAGLAGQPIPDSLESHMYDYRAVDSVGLFLSQYQSGDLDACGKPFFIALGFRKPHEVRFIPEKYFEPYYCYNFYQVPFDYPYNAPNNAYPYNGIVMPPQPDTLYNDFYQLPENGLGQFMAAYDSVYFEIENDIDEFQPLPYFNAAFSEEDRRAAAAQTINANFVSTYVAAVKFIDAQVGRLLDTLALYPEIANNTIIVLVGDHGYSIGEKRHWAKGTLWETDLRVPFVISDFRFPQPQTAHVSVGLTDVFPTLCDLSGIEQPTFSDGTPYLDGESLTHILSNAALQMERPVLSSYMEGKDFQLSCRPQHSLRGNRFHYIRYASNGPAGTSDCNDTAYFIEEELYEIGELHNVDPNEWHNLAYNPDYRPVINYLQQWLPDSVLYMQKTLIARIQQPTTACLPSQKDILSLSFNMFDELGMPISPPDSLQYVWTNNFSDNVIIGTQADFPLNEMPVDFYTTHNSMLWYMHAYGTNQVIRAFDIREVLFNPSTAPTVSFNLKRTGDLTVEVIDFIATGHYTQLQWDFGEGVMLTDEVPGPYTYAAPGNYTVTCHLYYGNDTSCVDSSSRIIELTKVPETPADLLTVYPNPSTDIIYVAASDPFNCGECLVYDLAGRLVFHADISQGPIYQFSIHVDAFPQGVYQIVYRNALEQRVGAFIVENK